ncbi:MAG: sulfurtransferase TusA family protein [Hydrotalea sp.]|nr:sulfurtransferase TusA family protein [Hydrotalea sp.]
MPNSIQHRINCRLDTSGLSCPLPVLKTQKQLRAMQGGEVLEVTATDPKAAEDFPLFCREQGHRLLQDNILHHGENNGKFVFIIEKKHDD